MMASTQETTAKEENEKEESENEKKQKRRISERLKDKSPISYLFEYDEEVFGDGGGSGSGNSLLPPRKKAATKKSQESESVSHLSDENIQVSKVLKLKLFKQQHDGAASSDESFSSSPIESATKSSVQRKTTVSPLILKENAKKKESSKKLLTMKPPSPLEQPQKAGSSKGKSSVSKQMPENKNLSSTSALSAVASVTKDKSTTATTPNIKNSNENKKKQQKYKAKVEPNVDRKKNAELLESKGKSKGTKQSEQKEEKLAPSTPSPPQQSSLESKPQPAKKKKTVEEQSEIEESLKKRGFINNDYCDVCKDPGYFICCEACPKSFHFHCAEPPVDPDNIPEADWYCRNCAPPLQQQQEHAVQISDRIWKRLLNQARKANARAFSIHCSFQSQIYFNSDAEQHSSGSAKKLIGGSDTTGSLVKSDEEKALHALCHECTKHFPENQLLKCSYCNLHWHMDCLNPPMSSKNFTTWKCPLHVNNYIPDKRKRAYCIYIDDDSSGGIETAFEQNNNSIIDNENEDVQIILNEDYQMENNQDWYEASFAATEDWLIRPQIIRRRPEQAVKLNFVKKIKKIENEEFINAGLDLLGLANLL